MSGDDVSQPPTPRSRLFRGRRRANAPGGPRTHRAVIVHSDDEWARVKALAQLQGVSVPRLYERAVWAGDVQTASRVAEIHLELAGVRRLLGNAASNINQVARVANGTGEIQEAEFRAAVDLMERQIGRINALVAQLPGGEVVS